MKYFLLLLTILCLSSNVRAQKIRFTDTTNQWKVTSASSDGISTHHYSYGGDTVIHQKQYRKVIASPLFSYSIAIREDTAGRVYFLIDTTETLAYDFSLLQGDTFTTVSQFNPTDTFEYYIDTITNVQINNQSHKVFTFVRTNKYSNGMGSFKVIEGVGCVDGFLFATYPQQGLASTRLICFKNKGIEPTIIPQVDHFDNFESCKVSVKMLPEQHNMTIAPHPANASSVITLPHEIRSGNIIVVNTLGQTVAQKSINLQEKISVGSLINRAGMYYYTITDKYSENVFHGKLLYK